MVKTPFFEGGSTLIPQMFRAGKLYSLSSPGNQDYKKILIFLSSKNVVVIIIYNIIILVVIINES